MYPVRTRPFGRLSVPDGLIAVPDGLTSVPDGFTRVPDAEVRVPDAFSVVPGVRLRGTDEFFEAFARCGDGLDSRRTPLRCQGMFGAALLGVGLTYVWVYVVATHGPRLFGARVHWFDATTSLGRKLGAAALSTVLTLLACFAVALGCSLAAPSEKPTTRVVVLPDSPAERGGLQTEDRITAIGTQRIESFAQIGEAVRWHEGPLLVEVRRGNETLRLEVEPKDQRLGVKSVMEKERRTLAEAAQLSSEMFRGAASSTLFPPTEHVLSGPVAIVRETSTNGRGDSLLILIALLQASAWLVVPLLHAFDFATLGPSRWRNAQSPHARDVFNLLALGATLVILLGWVAVSSAPLFELLAKTCGLALSLASFTALKRHLPLRRAGVLAALGSLIGPVLWLGTLLWLRRRTGPSIERIAEK
jgi:hypothetical protein